MIDKIKIQQELQDAANLLVDAAQKLGARCCVVIMVENDQMCVFNGGKDARNVMLREAMREQEEVVDERPFLGPRRAH